MNSPFLLRVPTTAGEEKNTLSNAGAHQSALGSDMRIASTSRTVSSQAPPTQSPSFPLVSQLSLADTAPFAMFPLDLLSLFVYEDSSRNNCHCSTAP